MADEAEKEKATRPFDLIHTSLGKELFVVTKGNKSYAGKLESYDAEINLYLKNAKETETGRVFERIVIKGGNILSLNLLKSKAK